jgi:hypothetical protein
MRSGSHARLRNIKLGIEGRRKFDLLADVDDSAINSIDLAEETQTRSMMTFSHACERVRG